MHDIEEERGGERVKGEKINLDYSLFDYSLKITLFLFQKCRNNLGSANIGKFYPQHPGMLMNMPPLIQDYYPNLIR